MLFQFGGHALPFALTGAMVHGDLTMRTVLLSDEPAGAAIAFTLNPTSAEIGNVVDRRGPSCYAAVYAAYNITYSIGMMATNAFAAIGTHMISLPPIFAGTAAALLVCIPLLLLKDQRVEVTSG